MFRASSAHLQDTVVHMQHMVLSLSMRGPGGYTYFASHNLMFFWPCIWIDCILITNLMHWLLFIH